MRQIAVIPARGGSKRLPRKNILPINGDPMIAYPIRAALASQLFDDVVVSTEDEEIAAIAEAFGASVICRPASLATDVASVVQVCTHALSLDPYRDVETFCCVYATAVLLQPSQIAQARELLNSAQADYVMGVSHYNYQPVQALKRVGGFLASMWPEYQEKKSQDYPELVVSNGTLYWARTPPFLEEKTFYGERLVGYTLDTVDVDTPADYEATCLIALQKGLQLR